MEEFYNNPAWRRIRGLRSFGILALSVAFCLTGLLALSSCDLEFWEDDDGDEMVDMREMRGFYISVTSDGTTECNYEDADVILRGDESSGKLEFAMETYNEDAFPGQKFVHQGTKVIRDGQKAIVSSYVTQNDDGTYNTPGSYFLNSSGDIFTGFWTGYLTRFDGIVICPYVLAPRADIGTEGCNGTTDADMVPMDIQKYLTQDDGSGGLILRGCYDVFDDDDTLSPMQR